uniref:Nudix hydrolase domain-containing protein n=1 Tax=Photinus pyralis TaxID=7054 RepID=A0A1Y1L567_PHOPY
MTSNLTNWRQSATVIIAAKTFVTSTSRCDYKILMVKRSRKSSVLPNATVFPGGAVDKSDTSKNWLKLYEKFGFKSEWLDSLNSNIDISLLFKSDDENEIPKSISLRIAAIRETFEETGILMCKNVKNISDETSSWADYITSEEIQKWQTKVNKNPNEFMKLCLHFEIFPDLWSLYDWNNWATPSVVRAKFNVMFFIAIFQSKPPAFADNGEISDVQWNSPSQYLDIWKAEKLSVTLPQFYEISRLNTFTNINDIQKFCKECSKRGLERYMPCIVTTTSGTFFLLPGDALYSKYLDVSKDNVDYLEEMPNSDVQHRVHMLPTGERRLIIKNFSPVYYVSPISSKL